MRCYDGCPDSELQSVLDGMAACRARIQARGFTVTYFPNGEFYLAFKGYHAVTPECRTLAELERALPPPG